MESNKTHHIGSPMPFSSFGAKRRSKENQRNVPISPISLSKYRVCNNSDPSDNRLKIPIATIKRDCIVLRHEFTGVNGGTLKNENSLSNLEDNKPKGDVSTGQKRRIKKILDSWFSAVISYNYRLKGRNKRSKRHLVFITLTLSDVQKHTDKFLNRNLLTPFIQELKRKYSIKHLLWKAETQENGNIHYHLVTDKYIDKDELQILWNRIQNKLNYLDTYILKYNRNNPPSTHIKEIQDFKKPVAYVMKYIGKSNEYRLLDCRAWGCTDKLRDLKSFEVVINHSLDNFIHSAINNGSTKVLEEDYYTLIIGNIFELLRDQFPLLYNSYLDYHVTQYQYLYFKSFSLPFSNNTTSSHLIKSKWQSSKQKSKQLKLNLQNQNSSYF